VSRLAFLSPLPPAATGIADYSAEVLALLAPRHEIDVFHDQPRVDERRLPRGCAIHPAREFVARHAERAYDVAVYQMGNSLAHAFLYPLLARVPGLLVLHDLVLNHARAREFLESDEAIAYKANPGDEVLRERLRARLRAYSDEIAYTYPAQAGRLDEAHLGTVGDLLPYAYPLVRLPVEASRVTAAHNDFVLEAVREEVPGAETVRIPMPVEGAPVPPEAVTALRESYGIAPGDFVIGAFGLLTREKRIETVARAVGRAAALLPHLRLLLVGPVPDRAALERALARAGVLRRTIVAGRVPFWTLPAHIEAADLVAHLRYPTARETSAALLRVLAQGRPTLIADLEHLADVPDDVVLRADVTDEEGELLRTILRLADDFRARIRLGQRARAFVKRAHAPARCLEAYEAAIEAARRLPDPQPRAWPAHWAALRG
jgi:glycosyltransferase involved in cell wall biosynthesis